MAKKSLRVSLKNKLLVIILAVIVVAIMVQGSITLRISEKALTEAVQGRLQSIASDVSNQVTALNEEQFRTLDSIAALNSMKDPSLSVEQKTKIISSIAERLDPSYENLGVYDAQGNTITRDGRYINLGDRPYIKKLLNGQRIILDPTLSSVTNSVLTQYGVPLYDSNNRVIGCIMLIVKGNAMLELVKNIELGGGMHPAIMSRATGETIANLNPTTEDEGTNVSDLDMNSGLGKVMGRIMQGESGDSDFIDPFTKAHITGSFQPIEGCDWSVFCTAPYDYYYGSLNYIKTALSICLVVSILLTVIVCGILISMLVKPLSKVKDAVKELSSGNADLTQRIPAATNDEIGDIVDGVNAFIEKLQEIVGNLKKSQKTLISVNENLQKSTQNASSSILQITSNINSVGQQVGEQTQSVDSTAGAVNEIASNIESLEKMVTTQSEGVSQASSAVEEMIGNINSVNSAVTKMVDSFKLLENNTRLGIKTQNDANLRIKDIEEQSKTLQEANNAISNISSQTNLLAMNAAIEAAHAGEAGKGFSVVADEIRKLSETSSAQSKKIGDELKKIQDSIEGVVAASSDTTAAFGAVSGNIDDTGIIIEQIKSAMEEQQIGSKQIIDALQSMNNSTTEVKGASAEMTAGNKQILEEIKALQNATRTISDSVTQMKSGAEVVAGAGDELLKISDDVSGSIEAIGSEIDLFRV